VKDCKFRSNYLKELESLRSQALPAQLRRLQALERTCIRLQIIGGETWLLTARAIPGGIISAQTWIKDGSSPCLILLVSTEILEAACWSLKDQGDRRLLQEAPGLEPIKTLQILQRAWESKIQDLNKVLSLGETANEALEGLHGS
jgi:hypothetical protein